MELSKKQKEHLLELISAGLKTREINKRALQFNPPYKVSRQQVDFYRDSRGVKLKEIEETSESEALRTGFAVLEKRVEALNQIAELMRQDLVGGRLWLDKVKTIGSGKFITRVDYKEFNRVELESFFEALDEIAKETGGRTYGIEEESEDDPAGAAEGGAQGQLRIKVEYVGNPPPAPDTAPGTAENSA